MCFTARIINPLWISLHLRFVPQPRVGRTLYPTLSSVPLMPSHPDPFTEWCPDQFLLRGLQASSTSARRARDKHGCTVPGSLTFTLLSDLNPAHPLLLILPSPPELMLPQWPAIPIAPHCFPNAFAHDTNRFRPKSPD